MNKTPIYIIQRQELLYPNVLFNLPQNPAHKPSLGIWAGNPGNFKSTSQIHEVMSVFSWPITQICSSSMAGMLPIEVDKLIYQVDKNGRISQTEVLIERLNQQTVNILGPDLNVGSVEQLLMERILSQTTRPSIITNQLFSLFKINPELYRSTELIVFANTRQFITLAANLGIGVSIAADSGINNKIDLLQRLNLGNKKFIVTDDEQIIAYDGVEGEKAGVYNSRVNLKSYQAIFLGMCAALISADNSQSTFLPNVLVACYLLDSLIGQQSSGSHLNVVSSKIKKLLNDNE